MGSSTAETLKEPVTTIGIIGAGEVGSQIARASLAKGYKIVIANSRGPVTLRALVDSWARRRVPRTGRGGRGDGARRATRPQPTRPLSTRCAWADLLLLDVLFYDTREPANYGMEARNGRQLADDAYDVIVSLAANTPLADGVSSGGDYLDVFPYLAPPKDPDPNLPPLVPREGG